MIIFVYQHDFDHHQLHLCHNDHQQKDALLPYFAAADSSVLSFQFPTNCLLGRSTAVPHDSDVGGNGGDAGGGDVGDDGGDGGDGGGDDGDCDDGGDGGGD